MKNWIFNEKVASDPQNLTESFFAFFARYYDAEEVIHKAHFLKLRKYLKIWAQN